MIPARVLAGAATLSLFAAVPVATALTAQAGKAPPPQPPAQPTPPPVAPGPRAIDRYEPKLYDVKFEVVISGFPATDQQRALNFENTPLVLPMIVRGPFSKVDPTTLKPQLFLDSQVDNGITKRARLDENQELGMTYAVLPIASFSGSAIRWNVSWRAQVWNCRVDEVLLARKTWPREWPTEVQDALKPQKGIESDRPFAQAIVKGAVGDRLRSMPPWHAAKEIVRACCIGMKSVSSDGWERRALGRVIGMKMEGAAWAADNERGSRHDLVAVCVAALRAAGLPARPVVGFAELSDRDNRRGRDKQTLLVSWAEVYIPDAGWIPFDPLELRGKAIRQLKVEDAWPTMGHWKELNERVPIAWCFAPRDYSGSDFASVWGWQPKGMTAASQMEAVIQLEMISRGRGIDDPGDPL